MKLFQKLLSFFESASSGRAIQAAVWRVHEKYVNGSFCLHGPEEHLAYILYRMPATYGATFSALARLKEVCGSFSPSTMLDLGSGPGTAIIAAMENFPSLAKAEGIEKDEQFCELFSSYCHLLEGCETKIRRADLAKVSSLENPVDLMTAAYSCGELSKDLRSTWLKMASLHSKAIVIVEPGTPAGWKCILECREILQSHQMVVVAPCPHNNACPRVGTTSWCHMSVRLPRTSVHRRIKGGTLGYEDEKFTYLVAVHADVARPFGRIIRAPCHRSGHTHLTLCTRSGEVKETVVSRKHKEIYPFVKRAKWGDPLWRGANESPCGPDESNGCGQAPQS